MKVDGFSVLKFQFLFFFLKFGKIPFCLWALYLYCNVDLLVCYRAQVVDAGFLFFGILMNLGLAVFFG